MSESACATAYRLKDNKIISAGRPLSLGQQADVKAMLQDRRLYDPRFSKGAGRGMKTEKALPNMLPWKLLSLVPPCRAPSYGSKGRAAAPPIWSSASNVSSCCSILQTKPSAAASGSFRAGTPSICRARHGDLSQRCSDSGTQRVTLVSRSLQRTSAPSESRRAPDRVGTKPNRPR